MPPAPISPSAPRQAAWSPAPRRHFSPLCIEKFCEQEAPLQLLEFAENPRPLGLPFSWVHALHSPQLNFRKHFVSSEALESFPRVQRDTGYTPMGHFFSPFLALPLSNLLFLSCAGQAARGMSWENISFAPSKSVGRWPLTPEVLHRLGLSMEVTTSLCLCSPRVGATALGRW